MLRSIPHIISLLAALNWISPVAAQSDKITQRIILVGDAGELKNGHHPVCEWLKEHVDWNDSINVLVYLGDNIYPKGLPAEGSRGVDEARAILHYQMSVVSGKKARAFFLPGNHDWKEGKSGGWHQVKNEGAYIDSLGLPNVELLPGGGCPGPVAVPLGEKVVLVCMDSEWWLQDISERPGVESGCDCKDERSVLNALKDIVGQYPDKLIVLAMHHPLYTHGEHGGYYTLKQHIFPLTDVKPGWWIPLPVIGSIYPIDRSVFGNVQDTRNPKYAELRSQLEAIIRDHNNIVDVAGHEHSLQLLRHDSVYYVVSGAGSKDTRVKMGKYSLMAEKAIGFAVIELHASGRPEIRFYRVDSATDLNHPFYSVTLPPLPERLDTAVALRSFPDSVTVAADPEFLSGRFKHFWLGRNYRQDWAVPVKVKVFDMTGWTPVERGGGNQTRSLHIINPQGVSYVLRGVKKYVTENALPVALQGDQFAMDLVTDGVSASYPYACLSVPPLAAALGVPHATPTMVYIPDDPRLGRFREDYGNMFAFLEEHEPGNGKKTYNMYDLEIMLKKDNDYLIDQHAALRARLLDMFVMDFDRHEDQWRWMLTEDGEEKVLAPVPRDRDQVFFINQGIIPYILGAPWATPQVQGFRPKARNIKTYNFNARNFDRNYLNELTEADWSAATDFTLSKMTDSLIEYALKLQPKEIQGNSMDKIISKLEERRVYFKEEMMKYYRFLSKTVSIYGSDKRELFDVERKAEDTVIVTEHRISKDGSVGRVVYRRVFVAAVTSEIRIYGEGGDDRFVVHGEDGGRIVVRIDGGAGNDQYQGDAAAPASKTKFYDLSTEQNSFTGTGLYQTYLSKDPAINTVDKLGYKYDVFRPMLSAAYNPDDGVFLGLGFQYTTQGFHKEPYKTMQVLTVDHSLATKAYLFKYRFEAIDAVGKLDFLVHMDVRAPNNTINFFGFGNETVYDKHEPEGVRYYRARYDSYDFDVQLRKRFGTFFSIAAGPVFEYFSLDSADNFDRYINQTEINGLNKVQLYEDKAYVGGRADVILDKRDSKILPSKGIFWDTRFSSFGGANSFSHDYSKLNSDLSIYTSFDPRQNVVIGNRVGWGKSFGEYDFYNAQFLGATENLRGYRKYRYAGDEAFYHNFDLRLKLADFNTYLFPGRLGVLFFNDIGRVWEHGQSSDQWHDGYGGGLWVSPLQKLVFSASYGQGTEGGVLLVKLGFLF
jgi:Omp85 superfamily domain